MTTMTNQITDKQKEDLSWLKWYLSALTKQYILSHSLTDTIVELQKKHDSIDLTAKTDRELMKDHIPFSTSSSSSDIDFEFDGGIIIGLLMGLAGLSAIIAIVPGIVLYDYVEAFLMVAKWIYGIFFVLCIGIFVLYKLFDIALDLPDFLSRFSKKKQREQQEARNNFQTILEIRRRQEGIRIAELRKQKEALAKDIEKCKECAMTASNMIERLYNIDVIDSKYHNFSAIYKIYDYISTGRCYELTGPFGAYNLYEHELKEEQKIQYLSYLPTISAQLLHIQQNQLFLSEQIRGAKSLITDIYNESVITNRLQSETLENTKLVAYNTKQIADNTKTIQNLLMYEKRLKGTIPSNMLADEIKNLY